MQRSTANSILAIILLSLVAAAIIFSSIQRDQVVTTLDKDTGKVIVSGNTSEDKGVISQSNYKPTVLADDKIFSLGMKVEEYQAMQALIDIYTKSTYGNKTYLVYTINSESITYDESLKTFSFRMSIKDKSSLLDTTLQREDGNKLRLVLRIGGDVKFNQTITVGT